MPTPFVKFNRPSESVVYRTLEDLCKGTGGRIKMSLSDLAQHCGLSISTTNRAVLDLTKRGLILYYRGYNQSRHSVFEVPAGREKLLAKTTAQSKIGIPQPNDSDSDSVLHVNAGDDDIGEVVHKQNVESGDTPEDRLAYRVADGLDDLKNLALYRSYCRRFPVEIILNAFARAKEPEPHKIKKSRGALFNFLVTTLYAKHKYK